MLHIPILRAGKPYRSLNTIDVTDFRSGEVLAKLSQANTGVIGKDYAKVEDNQRALSQMPLKRLLEICTQAAKHFMQDDLPLGDDTQSVADYLNQLSGSTGMPKVMCQANMGKISGALQHMEETLVGLTRNLDLAEIALQFRRESPTLGAILPNNSPGVHSLWLPAIPLQVPLVIKPGSREPWTPYRIIQAFIKAGCPREAFSYYPTDVNGTREILIRSGKSMFFGDKSTVEAWQGEARVQLHGPGWSKVILGEDQADRWESHLDLMVTSIAANGGRSCINASGLWCGGNGKAAADGLARRLAAIPARSMDDPEAQLSAFTNPKLAQMISRRIDSLIDAGGAADLTAKYRGDRLVELDGGSFLLPTLVWCDSPDHPLAQAEYLFPFCSVVQLPQNQIPLQLEETLVATVLSHDQNLIEALLAHGHIDRINIGPVPTVKIRWDQPHEGNLFEHLYKQRAVQHEPF